MLTKMISQQNAVLRQQIITATNHSHATTAYKRAKQKIKTDTLKIAAWSSNGLQQRALETKTFLYNNNIDILLVTETHFTPKSYMKISYYIVYDTKHLSGKAHGGIAVIIRNDIKYHLHSQVSKEYTQATTVTVQTSSNYFQLSAVYVPPRHKVTSQMWEEYFQHLEGQVHRSGRLQLKAHATGIKNYHSSR